MAKPADRPIAVYGAVVANLGIAVAKFVAAAFTGSSAMISEGIHSLVDTGNQGLLLLGTHQARRPTDESHPFGHGRLLYFWSLIVAMMLFGIGGGMSIYEGVTHILEPTPLEDPTISLVVLAIALVLEGGSWTVAARELLPEIREEGFWRAVTTSKDPRVITVLGEDSAALVGLVLAGTGIIGAHVFQEPRLDGAASVAIGAVLALVAVFLASESRGLLIGEGADTSVVERIRSTANANPAVTEVRSIRTMHLGPDEILLTMRVALEADGRRIPEVIGALRDSIREAEPRLTDITIEPSLAVRSVAVPSPATPSATPPSAPAPAEGSPPDRSG